MPVRVFISYSHHDDDLIFGEIKPLLQAATSVQIIVDKDDFRWGSLPKKNMEDAVRGSDFTLAVITQKFVDSDWAILEATLASDLARLMPIVFQMPSRMPSKIQEHHSYGEALNPLEWDGQFRRLLSYLGLTPEEAGQALQQRAPRNKQSLRYRIAHPLVQKELSAFWTTNKIAEPSYERLRACKELHDAFHKAQLSCRPVSEKKAEILDALGKCPEAATVDRLWRSMKQRTGELRASLTEVLAQARHWKVTEEPEAWEFDLQEGADDLKAAVEAKDPEQTKSSLEKIKAPLWREPTYLNRIIVAERDGLKFLELRAPLLRATDFLKIVSFEPAVAGFVKGFLDACGEFDATGERLLRLISNHNHLQALDDECAKLDESLDPPAKEILRLWRRVPDHVDKIAAQGLSAELEAGVDDLKATADDLKNAITDETSLKLIADDVPADEKPAAWLKLLRERYSDFRGAVNRTFHGTDSELRRASGDLVEALQRVQETLRELSA